MKKSLLVLLTLCYQATYSQKIAEKKWDKFDSVYLISTKEETLAGSKIGRRFVNVKFFYTWLKKAEFIDVPNAKYFSILIGFKSELITSTDNKTEIKVEFMDGTFGTYTRPDAEYKMVTDVGFFIFNIPLDDKLFTTDIKTIRISTSDANQDYEISHQKHRL